jgi:hypothetical protein
MRVEHEDNANTMGRWRPGYGWRAAPYHHLPFSTPTYFDLGLRLWANWTLY